LNSLNFFGYLEEDFEKIFFRHLTTKSLQQQKKPVTCRA
jgi:hypothetical protein